MPLPWLRGMPCRTVLFAVLAFGALPAGWGEDASFAAPALREGTNLRRQTQLAETTDTEDTTPAPDDSTTEPEEDDSTTIPPPPADENVLNIMQEILGFFYQAIYNSPRQSFVALTAFVLGLILVINGKRFYEGLLVFCVGAVVMVMAMNFVVSLWALKFHSPIVITVGAEVALVAAYSAWRGIEGLNITAGVSFGFFLAFRLQRALVLCGLKSLSVDEGSQWGVVIFYTVLVLLLMLTFRKEGHLRALAFLSPIIGGLLIASALAWGVTTLAARGYMKFVADAMPELSPVAAPWVAFMQNLFELHTKDVGFFAGSPYNIQASSCTTDRFVGWAVWLICTAVGWKLQKPFRRKPKVAAGRELEQPLLEG